MRIRYNLRRSVIIEYGAAMYRRIIYLLSMTIERIEGIMDPLALSWTGKIYSDFSNGKVKEILSIAFPLASQ
jgi:hypothetical protein